MSRSCPERAVRDGRLVEHERLGDLEDEGRGSRPVAREDRRDLRGEAGLDGLARRDVDAHRRAPRAPAPASRSARSWRQADVVTSRPSGTMSPVSSASGMNSIGGTSPRSGWRQRTSASKPTIRLGRELDDRLVVELELLLLDRRPELRLHLEAAPRPDPHRRVEDGVAGPCPGPWPRTSRRRRGPAGRRRPISVARRGRSRR